MSFQDGSESASTPSRSKIISESIQRNKSGNAENLKAEKDERLPHDRARNKMKLMPTLARILAAVFIILLTANSADAQDFSGILRWRNVGPYRGGRTRAVGGVPSQPNLFYMAPVNGRVFKSID